MNRVIAILFFVLAVGQLWPSKERIVQMVRHRGKCNIFPDKRDLVKAVAYALLCITFWNGG